MQPDVAAEERAAYKARVTTVNFRADLPDEKATAVLGARLAAGARPGDVVALQGELGAGKTALARAFVDARGGDEDVPSPTFTLVQTYDLPGGIVWHFDLYRLRAPEEAWELGIEDAFRDGISLIEWPERLGVLLPRQSLLVRLDFVAAGGRRATLSGSGDWAPRLAAIATETTGG